MPEFKKVVTASNANSLTWKKVSDFAKGEVLEGIYLGQFRNVNEQHGIDQQVYKIFTLDHDMVGLNASKALEDLFKAVRADSYIRLVHTGSRPTKSGNTFYAFDIYVADEDDQTAALRAASRQAGAAAEAARDASGGAKEEDAFFDSEDKIPF